MRRFVVGLLAVVGFVTLLIVGGGVALYVTADSGHPKPPARIVLEVDWRDLPQETSRGGGFGLGMFAPQPPTLSQTAELLRRAAKDPRVAGMIATLGGDVPGIASVQELRDAIAAFRAAGKFAVAYTESFDEGSSGLQNYYLATAFEKIWVQPSGDFGVVGLAAQVPFLKGALDKVGVRVEGGRRMEYKTAPNSFTETGFTPAHRENLQQLLDGLFDLVSADIARARGLTTADLRRLIDRAPLSAPEALQAKLIDATYYRDEARVEILLRAGDGADLFALADYGALGRDESPAGDSIALVVATGTIVSGDADDGPLSNDSLLAVERIVAAIEAAARDSDNKALVVRIDSPGGSYVASDTLRRALERARAGGKPLIVSFGDVAASGGYFAALPADAIVAQPGTITGSIGVFAVKPVLGELLESLGVKVETLTTGTNAAMSSPLRAFTPQQQALLDRQLDRIYADFTGKVAAARKLDATRLDRAARGRVFTGTQAKTAGLVDELGGLDRAIALAKSRAGIDASREVSLKRYPAEKEPLERLLDLVLGGKAPRMAMASDAGAPARLLARRLGELGLTWRAESLRLPPLPPLWR
ncbi:MAG: signal peptide peptidase SppA [Alphaproteobacteria bacterium]|nr:signal peptide peptidase SppA [Alphaproteobacteria bacterium]